MKHHKNLLYEGIHKLLESNYAFGELFKQTIWQRKENGNIVTLWDEIHGEMVFCLLSLLCESLGIAYSQSFETGAVLREG